MGTRYFSWGRRSYKWQQKARKTELQRRPHVWPVPYPELAGERPPQRHRLRRRRAQRLRDRSRKSRRKSRRYLFPMPTATSSGRGRITISIKSWAHILLWKMEEKECSLRYGHRMRQPFMSLAPSTAGMKISMPCRRSGRSASGPASFRESARMSSIST